MAKCSCGEAKDNVKSRLEPILAKYQGVRGALIPVLQEAQNEFGYLPEGVIVCIAESLGIPVSQVYGVVTFYAQFHLNPRGRNIIRICQGTACHVRGAKAILNKIEETLKIKSGQTTDDLRFTLETVACIGACGLAPVMMVNDNTHGRLTPDSAVEHLKQYE
ncbi:MAG: NADH-quinone oxidoreductase subunit NuoE [Negativicutes bacterium]|nr:NADH-quinone oxidoreductase subunit NuoE [Negativicutes bacterium]